VLIFRCISVAQFSALPHMVIAPPLPHPATPLLIGLADLVVKLASTGRPCGPAHIASRTRARRYAAGVTAVTPSASLTHVPRSRPRTSAQGTAPLSHVPQDHVPGRCHARSRFSGHVRFQWSRIHARTRRSRPHATSRPPVTVHCFPVTSPGHVPYSHSQSIPEAHVANVLTGERG